MKDGKKMRRRAWKEMEEEEHEKTVTGKEVLLLDESRNVEGRRVWTMLT
jgi:hypothetical protein